MDIFTNFIYISTPARSAWLLLMVGFNPECLENICRSLKSDVKLYASIHETLRIISETGQLEFHVSNFDGNISDILNIVL